MDRQVWKRTMTRQSAWPWPCPVCAHGRLQLDKSTLVVRETRSSKDYKDSKEDGYWEPDMTTERFTCVLVCNQPSCHEPVVVCGTTGEEQAPDGEGGWDWEEYLMPVFFHPALPIIATPKATPDQIRKEVEKAFATYWCDLLSCANRIRNAIELLLTYLKIPRFQIDPQKRRRRRLWLHQRIELFCKRSQQDRKLATMMFAVKVIGNEGSHPGKLTQDDLLDAFEMLEHLLKIFFVPPDADKISELAKAIHKRKKPRSHHVQRRRKRTSIVSVPPPATTT